MLNNRKFYMCPMQEPETFKCTCTNGSERPNYCKHAHFVSLKGKKRGDGRSSLICVIEADMMVQDRQKKLVFTATYINEFNKPVTKVFQTESAAIAYVDSLPGRVAYSCSWIENCEIQP